MPDDHSREAPKPSRSLLDEMRDIAAQLLNEQKNRAADVAHVFADALQQTGGTMQERDDKLVADYAHRAGETVERLSQTVRTKTFADLAEDTAAFARRKPKVFVLSAAAAGFLFGQLIHGGASAPSATPPTPSDSAGGRDI